MRTLPSAPYTDRMCTVTFLVFALLAASCAYATEYGRDMADPGNGEIVPLDIALDPESMIVYPGTPDPPQDCFQQSVNLHDFNRNLIAIKIVDTDVCYIKQSSETYQEVADRLHAQGEQNPIQQVTEEWATGEDAVKPEDVESRFGPLIANFCTGYDVFELDSEGTGKRRVKGCFLCIKCKVIIEDSTE